MAQSDLRPRRDEGASALVVDIDGVVVPARGIKRVAVRREDEVNMDALFGNWGLIRRQW